jgi:hypothetical protein
MHDEVDQHPVHRAHPERVPQQRRLVSGLEPGSLARRSFRVPNGAELLAGQSVRIGLASRDTPARLNLIVQIPVAQD